MEAPTEDVDIAKNGYEARIYSLDGKYKADFRDKEFVEKLNHCEHPTALWHQTKNLILDVENTLMPLKTKAEKLILETKGGSVIATMSLEDFFGLLEIAKRIEVGDRFKETSSRNVDVTTPAAKEIEDFLLEFEDE